MAEEYLLAKKALDIFVEERKALLDMLRFDIVDLADVQVRFEMNKNKILELHKEQYYFIATTKKNPKTGERLPIWRTYLPEEGVKPPNGRQTDARTEDKLNEKIIGYYMGEERRKKERAKTNFTFNEVYWQWRKVKDLELGDNSIGEYNSNFKRFFECSDFGYLPINTINENTIKVFMLESIKELALGREATGRLFGFIKNTIRHARIEKIILDNPMEFLEPKHFTKHCVEIEKLPEERYFSDSELALIQKELYKRYANDPAYMPPYAIELCLLTGMRPGEVAPLMWTDVTPHLIQVTKSKKYNRKTKTHYIDTTKTGKKRQFPMCEEIKNLLAKIKIIQKEYHIISDFIFAINDGDCINSGDISDCMQRIQKKLSIKGGSITGLRKTINSNLKSTGTSTIIVASILGHTEEVNENYYTYDTSGLEEKQRVVSERNARIKGLIN